MNDEHQKKIAEWEAKCKAQAENGYYSSNAFLADEYRKCLDDIRGRKKGWFQRYPPFFSAILIYRDERCCKASEIVVNKLYGPKTLPKLPLRKCTLARCRCNYNPVTRSKLQKLLKQGFTEMP